MPDVNLRPRALAARSFRKVEAQQGLGIDPAAPDPHRPVKVRAG